MMAHRIFGWCAVALVAGCGAEDSPLAWPTPAGFPAMSIPADNPMSVAKVELGRYLFYDPRLSFNQEISCSSCHEQEHAFADSRSTPTGGTGTALAHNSQSLTNAAYNAQYTWANPALDTLERQILIPMFAEVPIELGMAGHENEIY
ncbi:MAG: cytochrome c peroxidase, partial [Myxococcota bacterium]